MARQPRQRADDIFIGVRLPVEENFVVVTYRAMSFWLSFAAMALAVAALVLRSRTPETKARDP